MPAMSLNSSTSSCNADLLNFQRTSVRTPLLSFERRAATTKPGFAAQATYSPQYRSDCSRVSCFRLRMALPFFRLKADEHFFRERECVPKCAAGTVLLKPKRGARIHEPGRANEALPRVLSEHPKTRVWSGFRTKALVTTFNGSSVSGLMPPRK